MTLHSPSNWFSCPQPRPHARFRLFCFPYAGGGVAAYRAWSSQLPEDVEVRAIQLPGRDDRMREKPFSDLLLLVDALARGLAAKLTPPYAFFGHSMGGLVAYELIRGLRRSHAPLPVHLFVSARRAPHLSDPAPPCHQLPDDAFVQTLVRRYNGIPQAILAEPDLMRLFVPILRADFTLLETYRHLPEEPLQLPITIFGGMDDHHASHSELAAWKDMTTGTTDLHMVPGGHFFLQTSQAPVLSVVARQLLGGPRE